MYFDGEIIYIPNRVLRSKRISPGAFRVYGVLLSTASEFGWTFVEAGHVAAILGDPVPKIELWLRQLKRAGFISIPNPGTAIRIREHQPAPGW